jgi:hypothetical protein
MRTPVPRAFLLAVLVLLLAACATEGANKVTDDTGPIHDLFPPQAGVSPAGAAAKRPETAAKTGAPTLVAAAAGATVWPLLLTYEGTAFRVHEPVVETVNDGILTARSVVTAQASGQGRMALGSMTMKAVAEVDSAAGMALLADTEVLRVSFPPGVDTTQAWQEFLRFAAPPKIRTVPLATLESGRKVAEARQRAAAAATAPAIHIIVSERLAVLVYIDGDPRYVPVKGTDLMGVLNTRVLLLKEPQGSYYLHLYNGWVRAASLEGPWETAPNAPDTRGLERAVRESGRANLLLGKAGTDGRSPVLSDGRLPDVLVATVPTALIVLDGSPRYTSVAGTTLQYAVNTSAHLFRDAASGDLYVRVDGFWFRASDINGPWRHAPAASLPAGFSAIADDSPKRGVKASIAGAQTPTAGSDMKVVAVDPGTATLDLNMAGDPVLEPIRGTELNYVANSSVPIIQIDINNWYAVQNAVWFFATDVPGPWTVTSRIPTEIYSIPPGTPIYHAIHSRVMSSSTDVTYYGYSGGPGGAVSDEEQGADYQYTPPSGMSWGWFY